MDIGGISDSFNKLCNRYGKDDVVPWRDFREEWNKVKLDEISCEDFYKVIARKLEIDFEEVKRTFSNIEVDKEMKELVLKLLESYKIGILSNTTKDILRELLKIWDLNAVAKVTTSCYDKVKKPDTEAIDLIIKKLNVEKDEIIFIDDKLETIETYSEYGIKCIKFDSKEQLVEDLKKFGVEV